MFVVLNLSITERKKPRDRVKVARLCIRGVHINTQLHSMRMCVCVFSTFFVYDIRDILVKNAR